MKTPMMRAWAVLLLLAIASLATAAPTCASRTTAAPVVSGCVLETARAAGITAAPATLLHGHVATLPAIEGVSRGSSARVGVPPSFSSRSFDRPPLHTILRI